MDKLKRHIRAEQGQGHAEYSLIILLVAIVAIVILMQTGTVIENMFTKIMIVLEDPRHAGENLATWEAGPAATQTSRAAATRSARYIATRTARAAATRNARAVATRNAKIAATRTARAVATRNAKIAAARETEIAAGQIIITRVSAKREGSARLKVYVTVSTPAALTAVTSDGKSASARCIESCVIAISGVSDSAGTVTVMSPDGSSVSVRYPSKIVSDLLKPENATAVTGTASGLALALYLGKSLWWRVGFKIVSQCAASGKIDVALRIFHGVVVSGKASSAKASGAWRLINEPWTKNIQLVDLFNFFIKVERSVAKSLPSMRRFEFYFRLGRLSTRLGSFDDALSAFKSAEPLLHKVGVQNVTPMIQSTLFSGIGTAYIHAKGNVVANLLQANANLVKANEIALEVPDAETRREIGQGFGMIAKMLHQTREQEAWGIADIEGHQQDQPLHLNETYTLTAGIGWGDIPTEFRTAPTARFQLPEWVSIEPLEFDISVWAEDMVIEPLWIGSVRLDRSIEPPSLIQFKLTPKKAGQKTIKVDFYYRLHWLQQIRFEVEVEPPRVGMLLGEGGLGDKSFNDSAYDGLESAQQSYGIEFETAEARTLEESVAWLRQWAEAGCDLIIALGYHNGPAIAQVAESFPETCFATIDTEVQGNNVWSAVFREYEGDYAVGALAALITRKGRVGFMGGVETPIIRRIESAFWQGIKSVKPDTVLIAVYVNSFNDVPEGQSLAETLYTKEDVDVIYQAAGHSGIGAIQAAKHLEKLIISTGSDHSELAPASVITSRLKNVYRPVFDVVKSVVEDRFEGGKTYSYGVANGGISMTRIRPEVVQRLAKQLPPDLTMDEVRTCMEEVMEAVTSGQISVSLDKTERELGTIGPQ